MKKIEKKHFFIKNRGRIIKIIFNIIFDNYISKNNKIRAEK